MENRVKELVDNLNSEIFLPGLQREFVWNENLISKLFDSMMRDYPIGAITIWRVKNVESYYPYKFIKNFNQGDSKPPKIAEKEFKRFNELASHENTRVMIIDGQQRLNALLIGLKGSMADYSGGRGGSKKSPDDWEEKVLCVDLLGHPNKNKHNLFGDYSFQFRRIKEGSPENKTKHDYEGDKKIHRYWMPLRELCEGEAMNDKSALKNKAKKEIKESSIDVSSEDHNEFEEVARDVAGDFYTNILENEIEYEKVDHDNEEVKEIFRRLNLQKKDPQAYQLLQSNLMSVVALESDINPRSKLKTWIQDFQDDYDRFEGGINRKFFMRYSCYLANIELRKSAIKDLKPDEVRKIKDKWISNKSDKTYSRECGYFRKSLEKALDTVKEIGFDQKSIGSMSMVALIAKFYYEYPEADPSDSENQEEIFKFLSHALLLNQSYGIMRRSKARDMAEIIHKKKYPEEREKDEKYNYDEYKIEDKFPRKMLLNEMGFHPAAEDIDEVVKNTKYKKTDGDQKFTSTDVASVLGLLDEAYTGEDIGRFQVDHIFPKKEEKVSELENRVGEEVDIHRIGNLQLILKTDHKNKLGKWPRKWFDKKPNGEQIKQDNLYPEDIELKPENYKEFVEAREEKIKEKLKEKYVSENN